MQNLIIVKESFLKGEALFFMPFGDFVDFLP